MSDTIERVCLCREEDANDEDPGEATVSLVMTDSAFASGSCDSCATELPALLNQHKFQR